jgi:isopenicillin N synthase-like dioxygenase
MSSSVSLASSVIPVIDIGPARVGQDREAIAAQIDHACRTIGFFQIVGHGVDTALYHNYYRAAEALWVLTDDEAVAVSSPHPFRGLDRRRTDDGHIFVERFQNNHFENPEEAAQAGVPDEFLDWFVPNAWPAEADDLRAAYEALFEATRELGNTMMGLFALALGVDEATLMSNFNNDVSYMSVHSYPGVPNEAPRTPRVPEHTDSGLLSILHQHGNYEGLELRMASGERLTVPVIDDALVLNIGDLMGRWTNDQWLATPHAVIAGDNATQSRVSVATHYLPNVDAVVTPFESCIIEGSAVYEPVTPYSWEKRYFTKPSLVMRISDETGHTDTQTPS